MVVEKLVCFGVEREERAGGQGVKGKKIGIDGEIKVGEEKLVSLLDDDGLSEEKEVLQKMRAVLYSEERVGRLR